MHACRAFKYTLLSTKLSECTDMPLYLRPKSLPVQTQLLT